MVSKVSFLSTWPFWTSRFWYNQVIFRSRLLSTERWNAEFSSPTIYFSLSWSRPDISRDNCLLVRLWNMIFSLNVKFYQRRLYLSCITIHMQSFKYKMKEMYTNRNLVWKIPLRVKLICGKCLWIIYRLYSFYKSSYVVSLSNLNCIGCYGNPKCKKEPK